MGSTQDIAAETILKNDRSCSVVFAHNQVQGKGRLGRTWLSKPDESLTMTLIFWEYARWPKPWLIGMSVALAAAEILDCNVRWPNDLTYGENKVGGLLSEIFSDIPTVGIGINLLQKSFPPELPHAVSVLQATVQALEPMRTALAIIEQLQKRPEPKEWADLAPDWAKKDATPGKLYKLADGREGKAIKVTNEGALLCEVDGRVMEIMAAEALFPRSG